MSVNDHPLYRGAQYRLNAHRLSQLPSDSGLEVAFAGRSNAGKSTVINALTGQKGLARTSKTPGRTQHMVVFDLDEQRRLIDLPGYGYAKVPVKLRQHWDRTLDTFFRTRRSLRGLLIIMDIRHPLRDFDRQLLGWCQQAGLPCHVLLNKADKLKRGPATTTLHRVEAGLREAGLDASVQVFSALLRQGLETAYAVLDGWLELDEAP